MLVTLNMNKTNACPCHNGTPFGVFSWCQSFLVLPLKRVATIKVHVKEREIRWPYRVVSVSRSKKLHFSIVELLWFPPMGEKVDRKQERRAAQSILHHPPTIIPRVFMILILYIFFLEGWLSWWNLSSSTRLIILPLLPSINSARSNLLTGSSTSSQNNFWDVALMDSESGTLSMEIFCQLAVYSNFPISPERSVGKSMS